MMYSSNSSANVSRYTDIMRNLFSSLIDSHIILAGEDERTLDFLGNYDFPNMHDYLEAIKSSYMDLYELTMSAVENVWMAENVPEISERYFELVRMADITLRELELARGNVAGKIIRVAENDFTSRTSSSAQNTNP